MTSELLKQHIILTQRMFNEACAKSVAAEDEKREMGSRLNALRDLLNEAAAQEQAEKMKVEKDAGTAAQGQPQHGDDGTT